jgi:Effector-associated domain 11
MELLKKAIELVTDVYNNKAVKKFGDDFVSATVNWIRPIFLEEDKKLVEKLETNPMEPQTQNRLATQMEDLLEKEDFRKILIELLEKGKQSQQSINTNSMTQGAQSVGIQGSNFQGATVHINIGTSDTAEKKKLSDYTEGSFQEQLKNQIVDGKLSDVLETIIRRSKNDEDRKNTAYLQLGRWNSINREIDRGIVSRENASIELNRIKSAVLKMVDELN